MTTRNASSVIVKAVLHTNDGDVTTRYYGPFMPHTGSATNWFITRLEGELAASGRYKTWELSVEDVFIGDDESDCEVRPLR